VSRHDRDLMSGDDAVSDKFPPEGTNGRTLPNH